MSDITLEFVKKMNAHTLAHLMADKRGKGAGIIADCFQVLAEEIEKLKKSTNDVMALNKKLLDTDVAILRQALGMADDATNEEVEAACKKRYPGDMKISAIVDAAYSEQAEALNKLN